MASPSSSSYSKKNNEASSQTSESQSTKAENSSHNSKLIPLLSKFISKFFNQQANVTTPQSENQNLNDQTDTKIERIAENSFISFEPNVLTSENTSQQPELLSFSSIDDSADETFYDALDEEKKLRGKNFAKCINEAAVSGRTALGVGNENERNFIDNSSGDWQMRMNGSPREIFKTILSDNPLEKEFYNTSFIKWEQGRLLQLFFDSRLECDLETRCNDVDYLRDIASQYFVTTDNVMYQSACAMNIKRDHEIYKDLSQRLLGFCHKIKEFSNSWWEQAENYKVRKTDAIIDDIEQLKKKVVPALNQQQCHIMVIGDTGAGKSTSINTILEESLMPTGAIKTTSAICEIHYSQNKIFSIAPDHNSLFQIVNLDFSPKTSCSKALEIFVANQTDNRNKLAYVKCKLEWPNQLLSSGVVISDSPGLNDNDVLTHVILTYMAQCTVFICVINRGITKSLNELLCKLKSHGFTGESLFCIITHLDDLEEQNHRMKAVVSVKKHVKSLFSQFNPNNCVMLNPGKALAIFQRFKLYERSHFDFLRRFVPFTSKILTLKITVLADRIREIYQRLTDFIQIQYNFSIAEITKLTKILRELENRKQEFEKAKSRLIAKTNPIAIQFNQTAIETVISTFKSNDFKTRFMAAAIAYKLPTDQTDSFNWNDLEGELFTNVDTREYPILDIFGRIRNRKKLTDEYELKMRTAIKLNFRSNAKAAVGQVDYYKVRIQLHLIAWINDNLTTILLEKAEITTKAMWEECKNDLQVFNNEINDSYRLLLDENARNPIIKQNYHSVLKTIITNHVKKFSGVAKAALVVSTLGLALLAELIYDQIMGYTLTNIQKDAKPFKEAVAERLYERISNKLNNPNEKKKIIDQIIANPFAFIGNVLEPFERAYIEIEQLTRQQQAANNTEIWKSICSKYLQKMQSALKEFDNMKATTMNNWSLEPSQIHSQPSIRCLPSFDNSVIKDGELTVFSENIIDRPVVVRALMDDFDILQICEQTKTVHLINHPNILHCYGAYYHSSTVHIVTEPWTQTLENILGKTQLNLKCILQIGLQLFEAIQFLQNQTESYVNTDCIGLHTNSIMISSDFQVKLNFIANNENFLYQSPEYLFPEYQSSDTSPKSNNNNNNKELRNIIYSIGIIIYRLFHQNSDQIKYFNSGKWLMANEKATAQQLIIHFKDYVDYVHKNHHEKTFYYRSPIIDDTCNANDTLKKLMTSCYSVHSQERPDLNVITNIFKYELFKIDNNTIIPIGSRQRNLKPYGLLSIDGGGTRGIIAAKIIEILEEKLSSKPFWSLFDLCAGCSTGGILALSCIQRRTPGRELTELYHKLSSDVFSYQRLLPINEYSAEPLERHLKNHFDDIMLTPDNSNTSPKVFVVTKREKDTKPYLLRNYDLPIPTSPYDGCSGWLCRDAARATSAAPTYFKSFLKDRISYTDGGVGFNNPVQLLFEEALKLISFINKDSQSLSNHPIAYIVSIGTGEMPPLSQIAPDAHIGSRTLDAMFYTVEQATDSHNAHIQTQSVCERLNIPYFRFNPTLDARYDMTVTNELNNWIEKTICYMNNSANQIEKLRALIEGR